MLIWTVPLKFRSMPQCHSGSDRKTHYAIALRHCNSSAKRIEATSASCTGDSRNRRIAARCGPQQRCAGDYALLRGGSSSRLRLAAPSARRRRLVGVAGRRGRDHRRRRRRLRRRHRASHRRRRRGHVLVPGNTSSSLLHPPAQVVDDRVDVDLVLDDARRDEQHELGAVVLERPGCRTGRRGSGCGDSSGRPVRGVRLGLADEAAHHHRLARRHRDERLHRARVDRRRVAGDVRRCPGCSPRPARRA